MQLQGYYRKFFGSIDPYNRFLFLHLLVHIHTSKFTPIKTAIIFHFAIRISIWFYLKCIVYRVPLYIYTHTTKTYYNNIKTKKKRWKVGNIKFYRWKKRIRSIYYGFFFIYLFKFLFLNNCFYHHVNFSSFLISIRERYNKNTGVFFFLLSIDEQMTKISRDKQKTIKYL